MPLPKFITNFNSVSFMRSSLLVSSHSIIVKYISLILVSINLSLVSINDLKLSQDFIRTVVSKISLYKEKVEIILCENQLIKAIDSLTYGIPLPERTKIETENPIFLTRNICISQTSRNGSVLIISDSKNQQPHINSQLIKALARSFYWNELLLSGKVKTTTDIQEMEKLSTNRYVKKVINLRFLCPEIIEKILNGTHRKDLVVENLFKVKSLDWNEQFKALNL